ncbi:MAG: phage tail protein [Alistipes sp.]|nr:phage tail protein [Alistipes sp.]
MAKRKAIEGKDLMLFIDGKTIALSNSCTLNLNRGSNDASSKDDGVWAEDVPGDMAWDISTDGLFSAEETDTNNQLAYDALYSAMVEGKDLTIVFGKVSNPNQNGLPDGGWIAPTSNGYTGVAHVTNISATGAKGSAASMSVSLVGSGALTPIKNS